MTTTPFTPMALRPPLISPPATAIFLPREHGSWFLVLEPLALGLLVAPSSAGGALAVATLAAFFMRRPLKPAFSPIHSR
ncbi:MAG: YwiC-like family protein, partial [Oleiharenicola lentus]